MVVGCLVKELEAAEVDGDRIGTADLEALVTAD